MKRRIFAGRFAGLAAACSLLLACGPGEPTAGDGPGATTARTYQVRGILKSLPDSETGGGRLLIRHEAIPDLLGASGEVEGMEAMTMPFPVDDQVDLTGFEVGDAVSFELRVDWEASRAVAVTAMERLPADTELTLD